MKIDNIIYSDDINYLFKAFRYIEILIEKYPDINRNKLRKKLCKLAEKIDRIQEEKKSAFYSKKKVKERIEKLRQLILELEDKISVKKNKYYDLVEYFIFESRNISYLEQIFKTFPQTINLKNSSGDSIFYHVLKEYIEKVNVEEENEDMFYYKNVISLFYRRKEFVLDNYEKSKCLQLIYESVNKISKKDPNYREKLENLNELIVIVKKEIEKKTIRNVASYYNVKIDFEDSLIEELKMYQTTYSKMLYPDRKIIDDCMVTIDGVGAVEIDDGLTAKKLSNGNYLLGVHIASVLGYLPFESDLVQEAISRGSSIYLSKNGIYDSIDEYTNIIPIFPYQFSAIDASLIQEQHRLANSYFFEIDRCGNVVNQDFQKTIVRNNKKCTYQEVNKILENGSNDYVLDNTLQTLAYISYLLERSFKPSKFYEEYKKQTNDPAKIILGDSRAERIVNQAMILTGSKVAEWFKDSSRDYPCILRVHEINEECSNNLQQALDNFKVQADKEKFDNLFEILLGIYPKAHYDLVGRHDGQNLEYHCHITSPLRRSCDILNEYALDTCYFTKPTDKKLYELEKLLIENKNLINSQDNAIDYFLDDCRFQKKLVRKENNVKKNKKS